MGFGLVPLPLQQPREYHCKKTRPKNTGKGDSAGVSGRADPRPTAPGLRVCCGVPCGATLPGIRHAAWLSQKSGRGTLDGGLDVVAVWGEAAPAPQARRTAGPYWPRSSLGKRTAGQYRWQARYPRRGMYLQARPPSTWRAESTFFFYCGDRHVVVRTDGHVYEQKDTHALYTSLEPWALGLVL